MNVIHETIILLKFIILEHFATFLCNLIIFKLNFLRNIIASFIRIKIFYLIIRFIQTRWPFC
jgi:hypothetical protein